MLSLFFVFFIQLGSAPDEVYHYTFIQHFANNSLDPFLDKQTSDFILGATVPEVSYVYHYLMSFVYRIGETTGLNEVILLRLANLALAIGTLAVLYKISESLRINKKIRLALLFAIANMPMFMFLSSSINYDNLVILVAVTSVWLTLKINESFSASKLAFLTALTLIGPIIKMAYLPIALVMGGVIFYKLYSYRTSLKADIKNLYGKDKSRLAALLLIVVVPLFFASYKYAGNFIAYKQVNPACQKVLTHEQCMINPIYARTVKYNQQENNKQPMSFDKYMVSWVNLMANRTYGLFGHKTFTSTPQVMYAAVIGAYLLFIFFFRKITWRSFKRTIIPLLFIIYIAALVYTNYKSYVKRGDIALAVQGRYALPVLLPFILFVVHLYNQSLSDKTRQNIFVALMLVFAVIAGPLHVIKGIDPSWLTL